MRAGVCAECARLDGEVGAGDVYVQRRVYIGCGVLTSM